MTGTGCQLLADWGPGGPQLELGYSGGSGWIMGKSWGAGEGLPGRRAGQPKGPRNVFMVSLSMRNFFFFF